MNKVYTVHAYRWGQRERHSYLVGVYSTPERALSVAEQEEYDRGGKYDCEVLGWVLDEKQDVNSAETIKALPEQRVGLDGK